MKFFVTGRSSNISEVQRVIATIKQNGHDVTFDWPPLPSVKPYREKSNLAAEFAESAVSEIINADIYIILAHDDGNGVFTELGAALATAEIGKKLIIYAVAREIPDAMFHYHPLIHWKQSVEEVFDEVF